MHMSKKINKKKRKWKEERSSEEKEKSANLECYVSLPTSLTSLAVAFFHVSVTTAATNILSHQTVN